MKKIVISLLGLSFIGLVNAGESIATTKTTAIMQATCSIEVSPLGFGVVASPLMSQSAQSEMSVKCSNASAYTIDLAYGGIYGQGAPTVNYNLTINASGESHKYYDIKNNNQSIGIVYCHTTLGVAFGNENVATLYGYDYPAVNGNAWRRNITDVCNGSIIRKTNISISGNSYAYGVMQGSFKGDSLAYSIAVPGDATKVWNGGNNSYKSSGNGDFQIIPVIAKIVPDKSGSLYPAPDMYLDTITAVISY